MKTNYLFKRVKMYAVYSVVFLWATYVKAQCPIINSSTPIICNATGYTFANLSADYVTDGGNGIVWYNATGIEISNIERVQEGVYYVDNSLGSCGVRPSINVTFEIDPVPAGASIDKFYCSNEGATIQDYINDALALHVPLNGNVNVYYDLALTNQAGSTDLLGVGIVNYFIV